MIHNLIRNVIKKRREKSGCCRDGGLKPMNTDNQCFPWFQKSKSLVALTIRALHFTRYNELYPFWLQLILAPFGHYFSTFEIH